jgi:uncharacterized Zn finger protein
MAAPSALVLVCEECGEEGPHRVLSGRLAGKDALVFQGTVKCGACGAVRSVTMREDRPVSIPIIVSMGKESERSAIEFGPNELVTVGDRVELAGHRLEVTAIEVGERRVPMAKAESIRTLWAKQMDRVRVPVSVNKGNRTVSVAIEAVPEEEFEVGDIVDLGKERALIHRIVVEGKTLHRGSARAEEIVRMYGKVVRERTSY